MKKYFKTILVGCLIPFIGFCLLYFSLMLIIPACDLVENPEEGSECASCNSNKDCKDDMTCKWFDDYIQRCAKSSTRSCQGFRYR
jgi:hypothetical protein